jgi:hypothetical protein
MRRTAFHFGLSFAFAATITLCGCSPDKLDKLNRLNKLASIDKFLPSGANTLANKEAFDRALHLNSLTEGDQPFHLVLEITPPPDATKMRAEVEIFWLNQITYRTVIRSQDFTQTRVVNGRVVEEHDTGTFYPRWIQNFVDALLDPAPKASSLRMLPGTIPIGPTARACISNPVATPDSPDAVLAASSETGPSADPDETATAQVCFEGAGPRLSSGLTFTRYVSFDDFEPFGSQQIPRTLVNDLPVNLLVRGRITRLEPLRPADQALLKAREFTLPAKQIRTTLVSRQTAESLLESDVGPITGNAMQIPERQKPGAPRTVYIRTDRTGKVREAYRNPTDHFNLQDAAVSRALMLKFKPLIVNGAPQQLEAPISIP